MSAPRAVAGLPIDPNPKETAENKLSKIISDHNLPLGATPDGKAWCLKALHPSDPITMTEGIPDENSVPSVFMNYQSTHTVSVGTSVDEPWGFDMTITPHPVSFGAYRKTQAGGVSDWHPMLNPQLAGTSHVDKFMSFRSQCDRWRMAYMSVTIQQDAPALADQGHIAACQSVLSPVALNFSYPYTNSQVWACRTAIATNLSDEPGFEKLQSMPGAYFTRSKDGLYMPLKLTRTCQNWNSDATCVYLHPGELDSTTPGLVGTAPIPTTRSATWQSRYPFPGLDTLVYDPASKNFDGRVTSNLCNDVVGHISVVNVAPTTRFTVFVRAGYELQVLPGSVLTPQQRTSCEADALAISTYFAISRKMKDAYPAEYNDLGKIWDVISSVAKSILPGVAMVPGIPGLIGKGLLMGVNAGDAIRSKVSEAKQAVDAVERSKKGVASAVDQDLVRRVATSGGLSQRFSQTPRQPYPVRPQKSKNQKKGGFRP